LDNYHFTFKIIDGPKNYPNQMPKNKKSPSKKFLLSMGKQKLLLII